MRKPDSALSLELDSNLDVSFFDTLMHESNDLLSASEPRVSKSEVDGVDKTVINPKTPKPQKA